MGRIHDITAFLAQTGEDAPTLAERQLVAACQAGEQCILGEGLRPEGPDPELTVRADLLRSLILGGDETFTVDTNGVALLGGWITGQLDLSFALAKGQTFLVNCHFEFAVIALQTRFDLLNLSGSYLPGLIAQGANVTGPVFLRNGFESVGEVSFSGANIGGQINFSWSFLENAQGTALIAQRMNVTEAFIWQNVTIAAGSIDLASTHVGDLVDEKASWPKGSEQLYLHGFTYDRITGAFTDAPSRLEWLRRGTVWKGEFLPQPYSQLAKVLREMGHDSAARAVLVEQRALLGQAARRLRRQRPDGTVIPYHTVPAIAARNAVSWGVDSASRWLVGFGHRPWNALVALAGLFAVAWFLASAAWTEGSFAPSSDVILTSPAWTNLLATDCIGPLPDDYPDPCIQNPADKWSASAAPGMDWDSFHSAAYAVDLVIPILTLGQTEAWAPSKDRGPWGWGLWWGRWVLIAAGWFVTTLGVAAVTGIIRRE